MGYMKINTEMTKRAQGERRTSAARSMKIHHSIRRARSAPIVSRGCRLQSAQRAQDREPRIVCLRAGEDDEFKDSGLSADRKERVCNNESYGRTVSPIRNRSISRAARGLR